MATLVRDLMSQPPITCGADASLADAAQRMQAAQVGSVVVTEDTKVAGILTERDLLRAAAARCDPSVERVHLWMTANPDVLGPDEEVAAAWTSLSGHHYRHLPVVEAGGLVGVVSIRDLIGHARIRPAEEPRAEVPKGLEGVVVASTTIGDVRGEEGFFHYHQYSAVELAEKRTFEDVWHLLFVGELPDSASRRTFGSRTSALRSLPPGLETLLPLLVTRGTPLEILRTSVSLLGSELGWKALRDVDAETVWSDALGLCAVVPTILAAAWRLRNGLEPVPSRTDLGYAANYLWMLTGVEPTPEHARAVEQYLMLTVDHGFNASTFTARVITSTEADLAASICGAIGALSGPLHGGAPSRALDMLEAIGTPDRAEVWLRSAVERGDRLMGFGHRVYKTEDPRSHFLRQVAQDLGGPLVDFAIQVEETAVRVLAELKPGHRLYTNVEFFAGVVMESCGIPREMFTPTFAISRTVGWCVHVLEQAADNRLIRPAARYVGPPPPQPVPQI
ncbi:MAG TPA: citrate synthase [Acidimicrobiales bacterium]|nr:citrate synthase [Acidimicrobiales bacterium]